MSAVRKTIYEITWSLSSVLTLHKSMQLKLNADVKKLSNSAKNQGMCKTTASGDVNNAINQAQ